MTRPLPRHHHWHLVWRMALSGVAIFPLAGVALLRGMAIYRWVEGLPWSSAFLNAAMLLGGMGPVDPDRRKPRSRDDRG